MSDEIEYTDEWRDDTFPCGCCRCCGCTCYGLCLGCGAYFCDCDEDEEE